MKSLTKAVGGNETKYIQEVKSVKFSDKVDVGGKEKAKEKLTTVFFLKD